MYKKLIAEGGGDDDDDGKYSVFPNTRDSKILHDAIKLTLPLQIPSCAIRR